MYCYLRQTSCREDALINEFCKDKPTIFFSALNTTGKENLEALSKAIMSFERPETETVPEFSSYDAALEELTALSRMRKELFLLLTSTLPCEGKAGYFRNAAAYHRPQVGGVGDVSDSLRFFHEFYGKSGARYRKSIVWKKNRAI